MPGTNFEGPAPEWTVEPIPKPYAEALGEMERRVQNIAHGAAGEAIWLLEHPSVITAGTSANPLELKEADRFPVVAAGRGGRFTYHGPGQRVVYVMLDLQRRNPDVRHFVHCLEQWAIAALGTLGVVAFTSTAGTGIWVQQGSGMAKIGAIGVRIRRWVSFHGLSINVSTDLSHYDAIIPCGIREHGVTRLADLAPGIDMESLDAALQETLEPFLSRLSAGRDSTIMTLEAGQDCR